MKSQTTRHHLFLRILQGTIETSSEGIAVLDHQTGELLVHNKKFIELFKLNKEDTEQNNVMSKLSKQSLNPQDLKNVLNASKVEPFQEFQCELSLNQTNNFKVVHCRTNALTQEQKGHEVIIGRVWYFTDVTDYKTQEKRMIESAKMASLGELAGNIAHEISNPMTMIKNYSKKLSHITNNNRSIEDQVRLLQKAARSISSSTERVINIITGLQNISKNEEITSYKTTSLLSIVKEVKDLSLERINRNGIKLHIDVREDHNIYCNPVQIYQVLINLINNAIDSIIEAKTQEKWIRISQVIDEETISILVQDSGPGVEQRVAEKIFNPFFTTKDASRGTGLGLSLSKEIIQNHNGELSYEEHEGTSTFKAILPLVG